MLASNRRIVIAFVWAAALMFGAMWVVRTHRPPVSHRPVTLPTTLTGLAAVPPPGDFGQQASWVNVVGSELRGAAFAGRAYGTTRGGPLLNLTVARTNLAGKLDERAGAAPFIRRGAVTCTQTMDYGPITHTASIPHLDPHKVLCWRNTGELGVLVWALVTPDDYVDQTAAAVQQAWEVAR